jgi:oligosaccharide repeat unit polymerase
MVAAILLTLAMGAPILARRWTGDWMSPYALVVLVWAGTIALFFLRLLPYVPIDARTWLVIGAAIFLLLGGLHIGSRLPRGDRAGLTAQWDFERARRWVLPYAVAGLIGLAWYVWEVQARLGWDAFRDATRIRAALGDFTIPSEFLFLQYFSIAAPLLALVVVLFGHRLRWMDVIGASACTVGTWLSTDRTQFFTLGLVALFLYLHRQGRTMSLRRLLMTGTAVVLLLFVNFGFVARWVSKTPTATAYLYATASYPALHNALQRPPAYTNGAHTLFPVARLLQKAHLLQAPLPSPILDHTTVTTGGASVAQTFNAYTFLIYPYEDWGIAGALVYALALGIVVGLAHQRMRLDPRDPGRLVLVAFMFAALTLSPFVNKFNNTAWWYICLLTMLPCGLSKCKMTDAA